MKRIVNLECEKCGNVLRDQLIGKRIPRCKEKTDAGGSTCGGKQDLLWDQGGPGFTMLGLGYAKGRS